MPNTAVLDDKQVLNKKKTWRLVFHIIFFWFRIIIFVSIASCDLEEQVTDDFMLDKLDEISYVMQPNVFLLYSTFSAVIQHNLFKYYMSIYWMFHNSGVSIFIALYENHKTFYQIWLMFLILSISYFIEALFSIYNSYQMLAENNFRLFKKIGLNPEINKAYSVRKSLQAFGEVNMFVSFSILGKVFLLPKSYFGVFACLTTLYTFTSAIQQVLVSAFALDENVVQRRLAISFSIIKLILNSLLFFKIPQVNCFDPQQINILIDVCWILFFDTLIITIASLYYLIQDYRFFNCGLKEYFKFKSTRINLNSIYNGR